MARRRQEEDKKGLKLVGYIRVSTEEQARGGLSVEGQEQRILKYAEAMGHEVLKVFRDEGQSGKKSVFKRDGSRQALEAIQRKQAEGIIVWKLDRLGRNALEVIQVAKHASTRGWALLSATENLDSTNFMGRFVIQLFAALAEMESGRTGERVEMGMEQLVIKQRVRSFRTPFGWRMPDGKARPKTRERSKKDQRKIGEPDSREMVEHPEEQAILEKILKLRAQGNGAYKVASMLNNKGIRNPRTKGTWWPNTIESITRTARRHQSIIATS